MWRRYYCLTSLFSPILSMCALVAKTWPDKVVRWCRDGDFVRPVFSASRVQYISDVHSKFALRPHHVWKYGRHPVCDCCDKTTKKEEQSRRKKKKQDKNIMYASATRRAAINRLRQLVYTAVIRRRPMPGWTMVPGPTCCKF